VDKILTKVLEELGLVIGTLLGVDEVFKRVTAESNSLADQVNSLKNEASRLEDSLKKSDLELVGFMGKAAHSGEKMAAEIRAQNEKKIKEVRAQLDSLKPLAKADENGLAKIVISNDKIANFLEKNNQLLNTISSCLCSNVNNKIDNLPDLLPGPDLDLKTLTNPLTTQKECECPISESILSGTKIAQDESKKAVDDLQNLGTVASEIYENLKQKAQGWANTFVDSVLLGQQTFKGFIASVLDDLAKVALQQAVSPIKSFLGSAFKTVLGSLFRGSATPGVEFAPNIPIADVATFAASGGPITAGSPYVVGEHGPELFLSSSGGKIIPNHRLNGRGNGGNVISVNANVNINGGSVGSNGADPQTAMAVQRQFENMAKQAFQTQLRQEMRPGGMLTAGV
jgi:phage-related minor tail protein